MRSLILLLLTIFLTDIVSGQIYSTSSPYFEVSEEAVIKEEKDINANPRKIQILNHILKGGKYDNKIRPQGNNGSGPVNVNVNIYLRNIENIDDVRMEYTAQVTYRQYWRDPRLAFKHIQNNVEYLQILNKSQVWSPDVFFENEKKGTIHEIVRPNTFTRIYYDGSVLQSFRFTLLLSCPMDLRAYPLDFQECPLTMSSYGYSTKDIVLKWAKEPIEHKTFNMPQFRILKYDTQLCSSSTALDTFSCLELRIGLQRAFGFYLIQIYIPCAMLILVSWVSFWLEPTAVEARVSLGVTTILSIVTQTYGINLSAPPASYIKALDIWTADCQIHIFGGLLEFALVNYTSKLSSAMRRNLEQMDLNKLAVDNELNKEMEQTRINLNKAKKIDKVSRILFPAVFLLFNIIYWSFYGWLFYVI